MGAIYHIYGEKAATALPCKVCQPLYLLQRPKTPTKTPLPATKKLADSLLASRYNESIQKNQGQTLAGDDLSGRATRLNHLLGRL
jgi:hypothetical protein